MAHTVLTSLHRKGHHHRMNRHMVVDTLYIVITAPRSRYTCTCQSHKFKMQEMEKARGRAKNRIKHFHCQKNSQVRRQLLCNQQQKINQKGLPSPPSLQEDWNICHKSSVKVNMNCAASPFHSPKNRLHLWSKLCHLNVQQTDQNLQ